MISKTFSFIGWGPQPPKQGYICIRFARMTLCPNVSTTPLRQWGFRQCLPFSWTALRGKHHWHPIAIMEVVDTFFFASFGGPKSEKKILCYHMRPPWPQNLVRLLNTYPCNLVRPLNIYPCTQSSWCLPSSSIEYICICPLYLATHNKWSSTQKALIWK